MTARYRDVLVSSRTERVRELDVRIDTMRYERFLGTPPRVTILNSNEFYTVYITRSGKYVHVQWSEGCTSCGPVSHVRSVYELMSELRALPPEAFQ